MIRRPKNEPRHPYLRICAETVGLLAALWAGTFVGAIVISIASGAFDPASLPFDALVDNPPIFIASIGMIASGLFRCARRRIRR